MKLQDLLVSYHHSSRSNREKGEYFERLVRVFLEHDDIQKQYWSKVVPFADWAKEQGWKGTDIGIDLVATHADGSGYAAVQCKFYAPDHAVSKPDLDSFISAAANDLFTQLIIVDTTSGDFGGNAKTTLDRLSKTWNRIGLEHLEASRINWSEFIHSGGIKLVDKKTPHDHQNEAVQVVQDGLATADRGKLIMACGTGKTFTGLRIAEDMAGPGKHVLVMVPSLALMSQTVREWKNDCREDFTAFSACSDTRVGRRRGGADSLGPDIHDLAFSATTDSEILAYQVKSATTDKMTVVFSTYHSIDVLTQAQEKHGLPEFDFVICDEAHRTTGVTLHKEDESNFVRIHDDKWVKAKKRLYMTATPRVFSDAARIKADDHKATLASMDDPEKFGEELFRLGFGWAVENKFLTDYRVIVLGVDQGMISSSIQNRLKEGSELTLDEATKIIGCYKALSKTSPGINFESDPLPMKRALVFSQTIDKSKTIRDEFKKVVDEYIKIGKPDDLVPEVHHIDGKSNATQRDQELNWLKEDTDDNICRILSNVKVLSEGVDVPALDAIMFMHPRNSQIDVIQSVGRVMRKADDKNMGYVILPVVIPPDTTPVAALNNNERFKVIWQVLNALRAHDERFDARINQARLGEDISDRIAFGHVSAETEVKTENTTIVVDDFATSKFKSGTIKKSEEPPKNALVQSQFIFDEFIEAIMPILVRKCGNREYWEDWARDIARIAETHITRIATIVEKDGPEKIAFITFLDKIRDDLNPAISEMDAIEMLAQHLITRPVFDTLFKENEFTRNNPVSKAMETVLGQIDLHDLGKEAKSLEGFYASVKRRAEGIKSPQGRQALVVELYDKFFRTAFPAMTQKLGIVYTPVEIVDFIIHSVNDVIKSEFGQTLGSEGVHILDPFSGTGTFITRLLQSGLITREQLEHKYREEIHANEIVLLAYYIAAINIEAVYHDVMGPETPYTSFNGMVLTDTFQLHEQEHDLEAKASEELESNNSERRTRQKKLDIQVIMGNPPYSTGQKNANDDAANIAYPSLDAAISATYATESKASSLRNLYDSYIRAFRWASDRIGNAGVMAFVSGSGWIEKSFADGMRKSLTKEFSNLYVFHLRGDIRKNYLSNNVAGEGENIFGSGSMTGISIAVLVKNPEAREYGRIHFHDIGSDLTTKQKLDVIKSFISIDGISKSKGWKIIIPDENNDWLDQIDPKFDKFLPVGAKRSIEKGLFDNYSLGVATGRDAWCINPSSKKLLKNISNIVDFFHKEMDRFQQVEQTCKMSINEFIDNDPRKISWTRALKNDLRRSRRINVNKDGFVTTTLYRPFSKQTLYFSRRLNEMVYQIPQLYPFDKAENLAIQVSGVGARSGFSVLMSDQISNLVTVDSGQCYPLYLYEKPDPNDSLFTISDNQYNGYVRREAITDAGLAHFQAVYIGEEISKKDIFYYIYGLLHSPDYRERFKNNLAKALPRIPPVKTFDGFVAFRNAGRALGDLHVNFESVKPCSVTFREGSHDLFPEAQSNPEKFYRVKKMKFGRTGKEKDRTTVIYNDHITMENIPLDAYDYVVNGKPALQWIIDRQCVKTDKASGIVNDANDYANEIVGDPRYPLELFQRVITVSLETMKIVRGLPELDIDV